MFRAIFTGILLLLFVNQVSLASTDHCAEVSGKKTYETYETETKIAHMRELLNREIFLGGRSNGDMFVDLLLRYTDGEVYTNKILDQVFSRYCWHWVEDSPDGEEKFWYHFGGDLFSISGYYGAQLADKVSAGIKLAQKPKTRAAGYLEIAGAFEGGYPADEITRQLYVQALEAAESSTSPDREALIEQARGGIARTTEAYFLHLSTVTHDVRREFWIFRKRRMGLLKDMWRQGHENAGEPLPFNPDFILLTDFSNGEIHGRQLQGEDSLLGPFGPDETLKKVRYIISDEEGYGVVSIDVQGQPAGVGIGNDDDPNIRYPRRYSAFDRLRMFDDFLIKNPTYQPRARPYIDDLFFEYARNRDTIEAYQSYLHDFPEGKHAAEVTFEIESMYWRRAASTHSIDGYEEFIKRYPADRFTEEAVFQIARIQDSLDSYSQYLKAYPTGRYAERASFHQAEIHGTIAAYRSFLGKFPEGEYSEKANTAIRLEQELQAYQEARRADTTGAYRQFLEAHPSALQTPHARARLHLHIVLSDPSLGNFRTFYSNHNSRAVSRGEFNSVCSQLQKFADSNSSSPAYLLLYQQTQRREALASAIRNSRSVSDELPIVQTEPLIYFRPEGEAINLENPEIERTFWRKNPTLLLDARVPVSIQSNAVHGKYQARVRLTLDVSLQRRFAGLAYILVGPSVDKDWVEQEEAEVTVILKPRGGVSRVEFYFPRIEYEKLRTYSVAGQTRQHVVEIHVSDIEFLSISAN